MKANFGMYDKQMKGNSIYMEDNNQKESIPNNNYGKKTIVYLITIALIFIFIALFFIGHIVDRAEKRISDNGDINYPQNNTINEIIDERIINTLPSDNNNSRVIDDNIVTPKEKEEPVVDYSDRIKVKENQAEFDDLKELHIFENKYFNDRSIIAPGISGTYYFTVENDTKSNWLYNVNFKEQNDYNVNMVYKIKLNGAYIFGDENSWYKNSDFSKLDLPLHSNTIDLYTVEWKWEDTDYDTQIGQTEGANYKLSVNVIGTKNN